MEKFSNKLKQGITTIEVVFGVAIMGLVVVFTISTLGLFFTTSHEVLNKTQALYLAEEGMELLRFKRDQNWNNIDTLTLGNQYYLKINVTSISILNTPEIFDGTFTRSFRLEAVERDSDGDIVDSGTVDDNSRYAIFEVSWPTGSTTLTSVITDLHGI